MSLRREVLDEVDTALRDAIGGAVGAWERNVLRKQANPGRWASFHSEMFRQLPKRARIRKAWHKMRARRFQALVTAQAEAATAAQGKPCSVTAKLLERYPAV